MGRRDVAGAFGKGDKGAGAMDEEGFSEREALRRAGLRRTPFREALLGLLRRAEGPLSHGELLARMPCGDRVTLYRALEALERSGVVHRIQGTDGVWRFRAHAAEAPRCPGGHPHFLCTACGRMWCLEGQPWPTVTVPPGARVTDKQLVVSGICALCLAEEPSSRKEGVENAADPLAGR